jgi:hypothetical protein
MTSRHLCYPSRCAMEAYEPERPWQAVERLRTQERGAHADFLANAPDAVLIVEKRTRVAVIWRLYTETRDTLGCGTMTRASARQGIMGCFLPKSIFGARAQSIRSRSSRTEYDRAESRYRILVAFKCGHAAAPASAGFNTLYRRLRSIAHKAIADKKCPRDRAGMSTEAVCRGWGRFGERTSMRHSSWSSFDARLWRLNRRSISSQLRMSCWSQEGISVNSARTRFTTNSISLTPPLNRMS